ncbi:hypothetical protein [Flavobacterium sp.]|jgi:hypothetical protein|uniref:hypothetical protein n=1 Tax=Flavobacterium sp. TaxID=239 RepID=UPI0040481A68
MSDINKNSYSLAASIFRIYLSIHIFKKYFLYFFYREEIFGVKSVLIQNEDALFKLFNVNTIILRENLNILFTLILLLSVLFAFGIGRNITVFFLFLSIEVFQRLNVYILNGGDNLLKFIMLYMLLINSFDFFTYSKQKINFSKFRSLISDTGIIAIKIHVCIIYFISAIFKIHSDVWFNGIANYYILEIDRFSTVAKNFTFYKNYFFITITTYLTLFWELSFAYLVWQKSTRNYVLIGGVFLHLGIYFLMMIHDFEILFIATYILYFKNHEIINFVKVIYSKYYYVQSRFFVKNN